MSQGGCWKSSLNLSNQDDETESIYSTVGSYGDPREIPVGPFLLSLFQNQLYTDIEFSFKSTNECLSAHKVVLAAKCEFFADFLFGDKKNGTGTKLRTEIDIHNTSFTVFKDVITYLYTDDIDFPDLPTVFDIHTTANSFKVQSLIDLCEQYMNEFELNEDNACSTLQICYSKYTKDLKNRCIDFIKNHTSKVISSVNFGKNSFAIVREIVNLQDLNLRCESQMLEAVLRWINVQPDHAQVQLRKSLLKCIRFVSFTPMEFHDVIKQHPELMKSGDALDTLVYLNDPTSKNKKRLPNWMSRNSRIFVQIGNNISQKDTNQIKSGKIQIPLISTSTLQNVTNLTSFLKLRPKNGSYRINGIKIRLEDISNDGSSIAVIVLKASVVPCGFETIISRKIDSKEATINFPRGIVICSRELLNIEAEIHTSQSYKFLRYDNLKEKEITDDNFRFSVNSKPKQGRLYFFSEVFYKYMTPNALRNFRRDIRKKKRNKTENSGTEVKLL